MHPVSSEQLFDSFRLRDDAMFDGYMLSVHKHHMLYHKGKVDTQIALEGLLHNVLWNIIWNPDGDDGAKFAMRCLKRITEQDWRGDKPFNWGPLLYRVFDGLDKSTTQKAPSNVNSFSSVTLHYMYEYLRRMPSFSINRSTSDGETNPFIAYMLMSNMPVDYMNVFKTLRSNIDHQTKSYGTPIQIAAQDISSDDKLDLMLFNYTVTSLNTGHAFKLHPKSSLYKTIELLNQKHGNSYNLEKTYNSVESMLKSVLDNETLKRKHPKIAELLEKRLDKVVAAWNRCFAYNEAAHLIHNKRANQKGL